MDAAFEGGLSAVEELKMLKDQVQDVARVCRAVAIGDLSQKITIPVESEIMRGLKDAINSMVDKLGKFAEEVTRVSHEVGTEGKLGGQAVVIGVEGTWLHLTNVVNVLANNLTLQVRSIATVTKAVAQGDLSQQIEVDVQGEMLDLKNYVNDMVVKLRALAAEVTRVTLEVGSQGELGGQVQVVGLSGEWEKLAVNVNRMCMNLTNQVRSIAVVTTAVARGDLTRQVEIEAEGEIAALKDTINNMVSQLSTFASEVTRVTLEVGSQGKLGGQVRVEGVSGEWKHLTDNVNRMCDNLTNQVRSIAAVTTAVANGNLTQKVEITAEGEIAQLKDTINNMVAQLSVFASEVTRVTHEVGSQGKLGGQAQVQGVSGEWKRLTDNVNRMCMNLTNQVRSIAEVTTAVANGNLTQKVDIDAEGEIATLKDTINSMVHQLNTFASEVTRVTLEVGSKASLEDRCRSMA
ncbi:HAMP domain protein [Auriculariales sp. MPI-PUGE-AT-0066]|nr:HAMP domain protein [Auriculariales sp. MPI-PUGE-AT-0066]